MFSLVSVICSWEGRGMCVWAGPVDEKGVVHPVQVLSG